LFHFLLLAAVKMVSGELAMKSAATSQTQSPDKVRRTLAATAGALIACSLAAAPAKAVTVTPVILDLKTAGISLSGVVRVDDSFPTPLPVELRVTSATPTGFGLDDTTKTSDDLAVFPPTALIQPGRTQTFRVQYVGDLDLKQSRHYIVTVAQLPVAFQTGDSQVQVLYNFEVIVNVGPAGVKPHLVVDHTEIGKDDKGAPTALLYVKNDSATYGYLSHGALRVKELDQAGKTVFTKQFAAEEIQDKIGPGLVASGQIRQFVLPVVLPTASGTLQVSYAPGSE
jgi:P pilus assembly chaperone PapD